MEESPVIHHLSYLEGYFEEVVLATASRPYSDVKVFAKFS
jgi:hypothetical protein